MKRNLPNRNHWRVFYALRFGVLVFFTAMPAQGAQPQRPQARMPSSGPLQPARPAVLNMRVDDGRITATIIDSPMQVALNELAARTGVIFEVRSHDNPLVSVRLNHVSLQEAIQRVAPGNNAIYLYDSSPAGRERITLVRLFPRVDTSPQPSILYLGTGEVTKANDTADTPEQAMAVLTESQSIEARIRAVEVLVASRDDRAVNALVQAVSDTAPRVRASAIEGLASLDARAALPRVLRSLRDSSPTVRRSAATAVALLGTAQNVKDLKPLSTDRDAGVAAAAETAIRKLSASVKR